MEVALYMSGSNWKQLLGESVPSVMGTADIISKPLCDLCYAKKKLRGTSIR